MPIRLTAQGGDLPLAFQDVDTHLKGAGADAYLVRGQPVAGTDLDALLAREGVGPHALSLHGEFAQAGYRATFPWDTTTTLAGTLDVDSLARAIHALTRQFIAPYGKGNTPPEIYVTVIGINTTADAGFRPEPPKRRKGARFAAYLDTRTGEYVPLAKYKRSRAALRGVARKKGAARPHKGRYVRVLLPYPTDDDFELPEE